MIIAPPSPFYRVSLKALIFDDRGRLLVFQNGEGRGAYEIPGGGWEHGENVADCLARELLEEAGAPIVVDSPNACFVYRTLSEWGYQTLRLVYRAHLANPAQPLVPDDGMIAARFVTREEFLALPFVADDEPIKQFVDAIWPPVRKTRASRVEKNAVHL